jgi:uncharacterized protein (DUF433 family)
MERQHDRNLLRPHHHRPAVIGGQPCIRGLRVTVDAIVGQLRSGHSIDQILADYPYLEPEDVLQAIDLESTARQVSLSGVPILSS